jgi:pilus biogenesis lipoprotein CpaD
MQRQFEIKLLGIDMTRLAILIAVVFVSSCTSTVNTPSNSSVIFPKSKAAPVDQNSAFGEIEIDEESFIVEQDNFNANKLVSIITKQTRNKNSKQFFLIDLLSKEQATANEFARVANDALKATNLNFQIKVKSGDELNNQETVLVKLRSISIKPRDCAPTNPGPRQVLGGYYEAKFGCSYSNNIAAMIDNPRDTIAPRGHTFLDTPRAMKVLRSYLDGEVTGATRPEGEAGEVSEVSSSN